MIQRKNPKLAGKCIFCLGGAVPGNPMTGEHLWSAWMDKGKLLQRAGREYIESGTKFRRFTNEKTHVVRTREGSPHYKKIKAVCKNCNSGWMSKIEDDVKPVITPLILGHKKILTKPMRTKLAEWIVLKMFVAEHNEASGYKADAIYTQEEREAFYTSRKIPRYTRIYLAAHRSEKWATGYHRQASGLGKGSPFLPPPRDPTATNNVQATTWGIGRLLIYIAAATDGEVARAVRFVKSDALRRLYPLLSTSIAWPPTVTLSGHEIDGYASALADYLATTAAE